jgi:hypothetical protein
VLSVIGDADNPYTAAVRAASECRASSTGHNAPNASRAVLGSRCIGMHTPRPVGAWPNKPGHADLTVYLDQLAARFRLTQGAHLHASSDRRERYQVFRAIAGGVG